MLVRDEGMVLTLGEAISAQVVGHGSVESAAWLVGALGDFVKRRDRLVLESNHGTRVKGCIFGEDKPTNFKRT